MRPVIATTLFGPRLLIPPPPPPRVSPEDTVFIGVEVTPMCGSDLHTPLTLRHQEAVDQSSIDTSVVRWHSLEYSLNFWS